MCELCFLHNTAFEAINHMRKHQSAFFRSLPSTVLVYPTHELASIEWLLWKAKEVGPELLEGRTFRFVDFSAGTSRSYSKQQ